LLIRSQRIWIFSQDSLLDFYANIRLGKQLYKRSWFCYIFHYDLTHFKGDLFFRRISKFQIEKRFCHSRDPHSMQASISKSKSRRQPVSSKKTFRGKSARAEPVLERQSVRVDTRSARRNSTKRALKVSNALKCTISLEFVWYCFYL
jgi:hypothetical protein